MFIMILAAMPNEDDKAFMLNLYQNYYGLVRTTVYNIIHHTDNIEDLINDIFLKLIEKVSLLQTLDRCKTAAYVVYTSRSVAINFIKHRDVRSKHTYYGEDADMAEKIPSFEETVEERILRQEEIKDMVTTILNLPEKQKDLLYFKYFLDMDDTKIAEIMGIAPASVRQYLTRARRIAKKLMQKEMNRHAE